MLAKNWKKWKERRVLPIQACNRVAPRRLGRERKNEANLEELLKHGMKFGNAAPKQRLEPKRRSTKLPPLSIVHLIPRLNYLVNLETQPCIPNYNITPRNFAKLTKTKNKKVGFSLYEWHFVPLN